MAKTKSNRRRGKPATKSARVISSYTPQQSLTMGLHTYISLWAPSNCTAYSLGTEFTLNVSEPPPEYVTVDMGGSCNPVYAQLVE